MVISKVPEHAPFPMHKEGLLIRKEERSAGKMNIQPATLHWRRETGQQKRVMMGDNVRREMKKIRHIR